ncbi:tyrosine-type recombinase/integrase [Amazonocrinis nigriterrae]|uniref:tyrosine-type recombinase/integrase n=1 Tax=Amazonocrinis nigriterrae TaxID=2840443 RepID=UPI00298F25E2|nr:tyrosine-type recombinase/integrase [Amazonocrinis nigriterrae]
MQLRVADVYNEDSTPSEYINFRARTRKAKPKKAANDSDKPKQVRKNRQVPVHPILKELLAAYQSESDSVWLFPNRTGEKSIGLRWADKILRSAVEKAGLGSKGVSTHSTRRSFITNLAHKGGSLAKIKQLTGHTDLKVLARYIEVTDDDLKQTIALL